MKKITTKKLALHADTVRNLSGGQLRKAAGGDSIYQTVCLAGDCAPTGNFDCAGSALCPSGGGDGGVGGGGNLLTNYACVRRD